MPETKYAQIEWNVVDMIAAYRALDPYAVFVKMRYAPTARVTEENKSDYLSAARAYCEAFCKARIVLLPDREATYEADVDKEMQKLLPPSGL